MVELAELLAELAPRRLKKSFRATGGSEAVDIALQMAMIHTKRARFLSNLDNLKAAVLKADWFDPEINPKLANFCRHYRIHVMPCRPRMPQHKGKVERGVAYVRGNALKGRLFKSLAEQNLFLGQWEENVADRRIDGTTCKQVAARFEEERPHLQPLPPSLFPCYQEARRNVNRDSFVEVQRAFYEAPPEYIARQVWVRWDSRCVRAFAIWSKSTRPPPSTPLAPRHSRPAPGGSRTSSASSANQTSRPALHSPRAIL
jgi:Mu transposase-like protein